MVQREKAPARHASAAASGGRVLRAPTGSYRTDQAQAPGRWQPSTGGSSGAVLAPRGSLFHILRGASAMG